jgi:hypothetical protein
MASKWTVAIEIVAGHVPAQSLLILGPQPLAGMQTYGAHTLFRYADEKSGHTYFVRGYVVPLTLLGTPVQEIDLFGDETAGDAAGRMAAAEQVDKRPHSDPRVVLACLPSLDRLRGHASTRWFAPSTCPSWHR